MVFNNYAKYYNLLYSDKNYKSEADYVKELIKEYANSSSNLLDIGCGTGKHASLLAQENIAVTGIDLSEEMIKIAKSKNYPNCNFNIANACDFSYNNKFDIITSLFHVISYQTTNQAIEQTFTNIEKHLNSNGIFIFDFWYTTAVLIQKPTIKIKRLEDEDIEVIRISEPVHHYNDNVIDVNFDLHIKDKLTQKTETFKELHKMRYFSIPELSYFLIKSGLQPIKFEEWLSKSTPSENTWGVCCIAKKQ